VSAPDGNVETTLPDALTVEFAPITAVGEQFLRRAFGEPASLAYKPRLDAHLRR